MEIPSQEAEMPIPLNSTYGEGHTHAHAHVNMMHHHHHHHHDPPPSSHNHIISSPPPQIIPPSGPTHISSTHDHDDDDDDDDVHDHTNNHNIAIVPFKKPVKYKECLKNHAASMGGNATDGCGEFMPSGDEGTLEALTCSACNCHRNFHRKETENGPTDNNSKKLYLGHRYLGQDYHHQISSRAHQYGPAHPHHPHPMIMSYNMGGGGGSLPSESDDGGGMAAAARPAKKRFRTKFSQEQKEKMQRFAEKVGWKMQKQEEGVVQQFCQEVGVKRRVLKVWMHNNKHNLANKPLLIQQQNPNNNNNSDHNHL
ncbi:hypothetical protein CASFOL_035674 [Castilleja foliolosa]|uniref:ZF-HD dimerization-type domain-containing protein n=1 Tax=Castilleja foliolosa TaxID=1961234 RepID=A0ABD3BVM8_9LAMI